MENLYTQVTNYLWTQSWQIAALIVAIAVVTLILKNKSAHVRYLLWLLVLAKCFVPPLLTIPLAVLPQQQIPEPVTETVIETHAVTVEPVETVAAEPSVSPTTPLATPVALAAPSVMERLAQIAIHQWLAFTWFAGAGIFSLVAVIKALRTNRWLRRQRRPLSAELQTGVKELFADLGVKTIPKLWLIDGVGQPFVWGLLRGGIYLPANFARLNSAEHKRDVLGHELSHVLRFDAAVNLLQIIAQGIFWFHPFVWWANKKIRAEREKCCDEMAIAGLNVKCKDYSTAIVNTLIAEYESTQPVPSLAIAGPVKNIEDRIKTIMNPGKKFYKRPGVLVIISIVFLALIAVPTTIALTTRKTDKTDVQVEGIQSFAEDLNGEEILHKLRSFDDSFLQNQTFVMEIEEPTHFYKRDKSPIKIKITLTSDGNSIGWEKEIYYMSQPSYRERTPNRDIDYDRNGNLIVWRTIRERGLIEDDFQARQREMMLIRVSPQGDIVEEEGAPIVEFRRPLPLDSVKVLDFKRPIWSTGRGFADSINRIIEAKEDPNGLISFSAHGSFGSNLEGTWKMVVEPKAAYIVRSASFTPEGAEKPYFVLTTTGTKWFEGGSLAEEARFFLVLGDETEITTTKTEQFKPEPDFSLFNKLRETLRGTLPDNTDVHDYRNSPDIPVRYRVGRAVSKETDVQIEVEKPAELLVQKKKHKGPKEYGIVEFKQNDEAYTQPGIWKYEWDIELAPDVSESNTFQILKTTTVVSGQTDLHPDIAVQKIIDESVIEKKYKSGSLKCRLYVGDYEPSFTYHKYGQKLSGWLCGFYMNHMSRSKTMLFPGKEVANFKPNKQGNFVGSDLELLSFETSEENIKYEHKVILRKTNSASVSKSAELVDGEDLSEGMKQLLARRLPGIDVNNLTFRSADSNEIRPAQSIEEPLRVRWIYHLSTEDKKKVELVAVCRPKENPRRFWDPGGNIIEGKDFWSQSRTVAFELAVVLERPQQSEGENPAPDGKFYSLYGWKEFDPNKPLKVSYASGYGDWVDMGTIKEVQDLGAYNLTEVTEVDNRMSKLVRAKMFWKFNPEFGIRLVAVDSKGKEYPMEASDGFIGSFQKGQQMLYYQHAMGLNKKELSHFKLQRRPLAWAEFSGFATEPKKPDVQLEEGQNTIGVKLNRHLVYLSLSFHTIFKYLQRCFTRRLASFYTIFN